MIFFRKRKKLMVKAGDILTWRFDLINDGGQVIFTKGQKVEVSDATIEKGHYSRICPDIWIKEQLLWVQLVGEYGLYQPDCFVELNNNK
jgi:hypothetical protein